MTVKPLKTLFRTELEELSAYRVPAEPPAVKLDANESPWPLSGDAKEQILRAIGGIAMNRYPDGRATLLREALSARLGGQPEQYLVGAGSDEVIALLATALSRPRPGRDRPTVLFPTPTFVMYGVTNRGHGWSPIGVPLDADWDLDVDTMSVALEREAPNVAYYATPNNPTGNQFTRTRLEAIVDAFPDTLHVIDEAYVAFAPSSLSDWCASRPHCALLGTLSKVGFAAIRLGWVRMHQELTEELDKVRQPFNVNGLSQAVATLALTELAPALHAQAAAIVRERAALAASIDALPALRSFPSAANFLLVESQVDAVGLCESLLQHGVAVRRFASEPRLSSCIRITIGTPEENQHLLGALEQIL